MADLTYAIGGRVWETGLVELISDDTAAVAQNAYGPSVSLGAFVGDNTGAILRSAHVIQTETGSGAILSDLEGRLWLFDSDPSISAAATAMTAAERKQVIGVIEFFNADLQSDANAGFILGTFDPILIPEVAELYGVWEHLGATAINSAAGDDEVLEVRLVGELLTRK